MGEGPNDVPPTGADQPIGALPAGPVPRPTESGWQVNWMGFVPLAIVAALAFVGFRLIGLGDDEPSRAGAVSPDDSAPSTSAVVAAAVTAAPPTTLPATTVTVAPATTAPVTTVPAGPAVRAWGEIKPCRFGEACLSVSFAISGFVDPLPTTFQCIYPNSTRQFSFEGSGELEACLTGDEGDTVYIDVNGVRSGPVSATNLNP